jgi:hypothetical protein
MSKAETIDGLNHLRGVIGITDSDLLRLKAGIVESVKGPECGEALANMTLAHRKLEDARMRLGKVIQAIEGGVSILDHPKVKALIEEIRRADA